ncbi:OapC/ArvC family zinc-ribbon domain-containing protein [Haloplanus sp. C73]|uniref:OapC/ArvC family zinc-ribbon domain-containing protein n=1 Tax=Haloplanus sp. C73 TaxID=3421641 RepID=UPI003EC10C43
MPHQCTNCEREFPDGSKEMLSGCPECGGNKFQFKPDSATATPTLDDPPTTSPATDSADTSTTEADRSSPPADQSSSSNRTPWPDTAKPSDSSDDATTADAASASTDTPSTSTDADYIEAESDPSVLDNSEDTAQADARRDVVTSDELDDASSPPPSASDAARTIPPDSETDAAPGIEDLRAELNDQFESIKILEPGQYELNLMELYDRQECIISLQEDGHYVIEVADTWRDDT